MPTTSPAHPDSTSYSVKRLLHFLNQMARIKSWLFEKYHYKKFQAQRKPMYLLLKFNKCRNFVMRIGGLWAFSILLDIKNWTLVYIVAIESHLVFLEFYFLPVYLLQWCINFNLLNIRKIENVLIQLRNLRVFYCLSHSYPFLHSYYLSISLCVDSLYVLYSNYLTPKHFKYPFQVCDLFSNTGYITIFCHKELHHFNMVQCRHFFFSHLICALCVFFLKSFPLLWGHKINLLCYLMQMFSFHIDGFK